MPIKADFTLKVCLLGAVKLTKNADPDKYSYFGYGIGFDSCSLFSVPNFDWGKNVVSLRVGDSSSVHIDNKKKDILAFGKALTQGWDNTTITAEAEYSIDFSRSRRKFYLSLNFNRGNNFLIVNATKIYQFNGKDPEIKPYPLHLGDISKDFAVNNTNESIKWLRVQLFCWL